jgi:hypothetical protein
MAASTPPARSGGHGRQQPDRSRCTDPRPGRDRRHSERPGSRRHEEGSVRRRVGVEAQGQTTRQPWPRLLIVPTATVCRDRSGRDGSTGDQRRRWGAVHDACGTCAASAAPAVSGALITHLPVAPRSVVGHRASARCPSSPCRELRTVLSVAGRPLLELGAVADRDGQELGRFVDFEPMPPVTGHDGGLAGE